MDRSRFVGCHVRAGRKHEGFPACQGAGNPQITWAHGRQDNFIRFVGISELLGAIGLILPPVTGILPWLMVLAAIGLTLIQLLAIFTEHLPKKEYNIIPMNIVLLALSVFIIVGRWAFFS